MWSKEVLGVLHKEDSARALPPRHAVTPGVSYMDGEFCCMTQETSTHCTWISTLNKWSGNTLQPPN